MRNFTIEELQNDILELKFQLIRPNSADRLTQNFHFDTFFEQQLSAWKSMSVERQNKILKSMSRKYDMDNMTYAEFLTKLSKEAAVPRYSTFNVEMMNRLLRYNPSMVIDPCMGWGHRMLMCITRDIPYFASDIRDEAVENNIRLSEFVSTQMETPVSQLVNMDGAEYINNVPMVDDNAMLFTCPPYYDSEIYSEDGIENSSYDEFISWWKTIAENSIERGIKYFAYQITPNYGEDMKKVTEAAGYTFLHIIENTRERQTTSHINVKGHVSKRHYGQIYVFKNNNR